jgi:hypothetical protein
MESDILERIVDGSEKPSNLPFALLKNITKHFSEDRVIGHGGFAKVYMVRFTLNKVKHTVHKISMVALQLRLLLNAHKRS